MRQRTEKLVQAEGKGVVEDPGLQPRGTEDQLDDSDSCVPINGGRAYQKYWCWRGQSGKEVFVTRTIRPSLPSLCLRVGFVKRKNDVTLFGEGKSGKLKLGN